MHVAFVSQFDSRDIRSWSGIPYYMAHKLADHVDRVSIVGPLDEGTDVAGKLNVLRARLRGRTYLRAHTRPVLEAWAAEAEREIAKLKPDAVLAPGTLPVTLLDVDCPTASWCGSTFESNLYAYRDYTNLPDDFVAEAHELEEEALRRVRFAFYAGEHAAHSAVAFYGADPAKVHIVPYGPNLDPEPTPDEVAGLIEGRPLDRCNLLFLGVDWIRKGGDVAVRVAETLHRRGVDVTLTVVGEDPPLARPLPFVHALGYISKATEEGRRRLHRLLGESHFLLLPTRAENFGCVFSEASAFGVPSLAPAVGGVPTAVRDGVNGRLFPPRPGPAAIADAVQELLDQPDAYRALARSSRAEYERRLNWRDATGIVARHLTEAAA